MRHVDKHFAETVQRIEAKIDLLLKLEVLLRKDLHSMSDALKDINVKLAALST